MTMGYMSSQRRVIELTGEAQDVLDNHIDNTGMKKKALVQKIIGWWARQDPLIRSLVIGDIPKGYEERVAKMVLEAMAGLSPGPDSTDQPANPADKPTPAEEAGQVVADALETAAKRSKRAKSRRRQDSR